jgi:hypothetical protein
MIQTNISLSIELHQKIKQYGFRNRLSLSAVIRESLGKFLGPIQQESYKDTSASMTKSSKIKGVANTLLKDKPSPQIVVRTEQEKVLAYKRGELNPNNYI